MPTSEADLICLSSRRWDPVFQRSSHLMLRGGRDRRVFFVEEPDFHYGGAELEVTQTDQPVVRVVPKLPHGTSDSDLAFHLVRMIDALLLTSKIRRYELWYTTPSAVPHTRHLQPQLVVYDASEAASNPSLERELLERADLVFTSRQSVHQALAKAHRDVLAFPSSVDVKHFARARQPAADPTDQAAIAHPRLGCFGGVDARLDFQLLDRIAELQPDWHIVLLGEVTSWQAVDLQRRENI
jgi:UDP-galactopyranose mutase